MLSCYLSVTTLVIVLTIAPMDSVQAKVIDLSHKHGKDTFMSTPEMPKYTTQLLFDGDLAPGVYAKWSSYTIAEHGGTHIDSPNHFVKEGYSLDQIPLENTIADGIMIDCTEEVARNSTYLLSLEKVMEWEDVNGMIPAKAAVIVNFNWSHKFTNASAYLNPVNETDFSTYRFPSVSEEAINFLVDTRDINILAVDTMSPDLLNTDYPVHLKVLTNNKMIVENLKQPQLLPTKGFRFHASPVKFIGGTGVQTRVYAMIPDDDVQPGSGTALGISVLVIALSITSTFFLQEV